MVLIPLSPSGGKGRESRHVAVHGLPPTVSDEKINSFFSNYGRVQKVERQTTDDSVVVSFMDVRSAQKAHSGEKRMEPNLPFRITFHDPHVKIQPLSQPTTSIPSLMKTVVEPPKKPIVSSSTLNDAARMYAKRRDERNKREHIRAEVTAPSTSTSQCQQTASTSSQAIVVERLPVRSDSTIREQVRDHLKRFGKGIKDVLVEPDGELHRKATVVFNKVDAEKVIAEPQITILNSKVRLRIVPPPILPPLSPRSAAVQPSTSTDCLTPTPSLTPTPLDAEKKQNQQQPLPLKNADEVTVFHPKSSRTLYVGGLESRVSEESLRRRFTVYGDILDVDVKNFESPSPFAFLQFADINSAVRAINASAVMTNKKGKSSPTTTHENIQKFQPNFGRSMTSNKLWVGQIPDKVSEDYVTQKLKTLWDGNVDVVYDAREHQAIVIFPTNEASTFAYNRIRTGNPEPL